MKKIFTLSLLLSIGLFASNNTFFNFKETEIKNFQKEGELILFNPIQYLEHGDQYSLCALTVKDNKKIISMYCQPKNSINAIAADVSGIYNDNKVIIYTPLVEGVEVDTTKSMGK